MNEDAQMTVFNKVTYYTNCMVEVWENTCIGETTWCWYITENTEVLEDE